MIRVLVTGDRNYTDRQAVYEELSRLQNETLAPDKANPGKTLVTSYSFTGPHAEPIRLLRMWHKNLVGQLRAILPIGSNTEGLPGQSAIRKCWKAVIQILLLLFINTFLNRKVRNIW